VAAIRKIAIAPRAAAFGREATVYAINVRRGLMMLELGSIKRNHNRPVSTPCDLSRCSPNQRVQRARIKTGLAVVLPAQLKEGESVLVGAKATVDRLG
jgi:hypothetical protein